MPTGSPAREKECIICKKLFLPLKPSNRICDDDHFTSCPICGKQMLWNSTRKVEPCSKECRKENTRRNNLAKYGVEHPMQSKEVQANHKKAMLDKYGVESPLQSEELKQKAIQSVRAKYGVDWALSSAEVKEKSKSTMIDRYGGATTFQSNVLREKVTSTCLERYGVDNAGKSQEVIEKRTSTLMDRYGVDNPMKCAEVANKARETRVTNHSGRYWTEEMYGKAQQAWLEHLGVDNPAKSDEIIDKITHTFLERYGVVRAVHVPEFREKMIATMIERYNAPYYCMTKEYTDKSHFKISKVNKTFGNTLSTIGIEHEYEFNIGRKSYDIHLHNTNILIEIDPTYTHNVIGNHWDKEGLAEDYHYLKSKLAQENGYRCIHVFDWDDADKIVDLIRPKEKLYARNMSIYKLNLDVCEEFLNQFHLQGSCKGQLLCLGLVQDGILYQVMTFGKSRYDKSHDVELLRLCTRAGYIVVGGANKLFKYATQDYGLDNIISYCDLSKFNGDVYTRLGMKLIRTTQPQEVWSRENEKVTANLLRQRGYDQLFKTNYGKGTSNEELMLRNGWLPIFDCGQAVYEYKC